MMKQIVLILFLLSSVAAGAQTLPPAADGDGRFTFNRVQDGFLRFDSRSGQVSLCNRRTAGWACEAVPEERTAMESEIAKLQADNAALKKELASRGLTLPDSVKAEPAPPKGPNLEIRLPSNKDIERAMEYLEKVWRGVVDAITAAQKEVFKI
jgi:hypothetical protein